MTASPKGRRRPVKKVLLLFSGIVLAGVIWWLIPSRLVGIGEAGPPEGPWAAWRRQVTLLEGQGKQPEIEFTWIELGSMPVDLLVSVIVAEDIGFFRHHGVDWTAVREALQEWLRGEGLRGASTITQQLAKNLYLSDRRSIIRKLREARLARALEKRFGKRRILELYLNVIEFGPGILGVEEASRHYFGTSVGGLSRGMAVELAATIPSPRRNNPYTRTASWQKRCETILLRVNDSEWLYRRVLHLY